MGTSLNTVTAASKLNAKAGEFAYRRFLCQLVSSSRVALTYRDATTFSQNGDRQGSHLGNFSKQSQRYCLRLLVRSYAHCWYQKEMSKVRPKLQQRLQRLHAGWRKWQPHTMPSRWLVPQLFRQIHGPSGCLIQQSRHWANFHLTNRQCASQLQIVEQQAECIHACMAPPSDCIRKCI